MTSPAKPSLRGQASKKRHWWRWTVGGLIALGVIVVAAIGLFITLQATPAPLALPTEASKPPVGPLDGTWQTAEGSVAGFRVRESFLWFGNDVVGRTTDVTGDMTVADGNVTEAKFRVDLTAIKVGGKVQSQFAKILNTSRHPNATVTLVQPVAIGRPLENGKAMSRTTTAMLTMDGSSQPVTLRFSGRQDGTQLQVAGSVPVAFSRWNIAAPQGLADHGVAEFYLVLRRD